MRTYKKPSTILNKAADDLEQEGHWVQGAMMCAQGKRCAVGAIAWFSGDLEPIKGNLYLVKDWDTEKEGVLEMQNVKNNPSDQFKFAIGYAAKALQPDEYQYLYDEYYTDNSYYDEAPLSEPEFMINETNDLMEKVIDTNDASDFYRQTTLNQTRAQSEKTRKNIVKGLRKAAKLAQKDGK